MNIGILGSGFGAYHAEIYQGIPGIEKVYLFGRNEEKLKSIEENLHVTTTTNCNDILDNDEIDLIDICLPNALHREYVIKALEKGKHVFCETPVALSNADTKAMLEAEQIYKRKVFIDLFLRFEPPYRFLYDLKKSGRHGALLSFVIQRKTPPIWGDLGADKIATNLMIHDIDFTYWLLGKPADVHAYHVPGGTGQSAVTALLKYGHTLAEVIGSSLMAHAHPFSVSYEAVFEKAVLRYSMDYKENAKACLELFTSESITDVDIEDTHCLSEAIKHIVHCVNNNLEGINRLSEASTSLDIALEVRRQITAVRQ